MAITISGSGTISGLTSNIAPPGTISYFSLSTAPTGFLAADGSAVSRTTYAALFAVIGTTYGSGNGSTTFNLPDLRGYFVRSSGTNGDGTAAGTFGSKQADDFKSHSHTFPLYNSGGGVIVATGTGGTSVGTPSTNATGGTETRPKNIALLACIAY